MDKIQKILEKFNETSTTPEELKFYAKGILETIEKDANIENIKNKEEVEWLQKVKKVCIKIVNRK
jgi:hypothetical protein